MAPRDVIPDPDRARYERKALTDEIAYRRDRRSGIFTWASSILIAVTGGVIAIQLNSGRSLNDPQKIILSSAVIVLGTYAGLWWDKQRRRGRTLRQKLAGVDAVLGIDMPEHDDGPLNKVGGLLAIILLTIAAVAAIWVSTAVSP